MKRTFTLLVACLMVVIFNNLQAQSNELLFDFETWVDSSDYQRPEPVDILSDPNAYVRYLGDFLQNPSGGLVAQCAPTSDAKNGSQAAVLTSQFYYYFTYQVVLRGWLHTGLINYNGQTFVTSTDLRIENNQKYTTFSGWYKYHPSDDIQDSCVFIAELYAADSTVIASATFKSGAITDYTQFEVPFVYTDNNTEVTHMGMYICASNGTAGSSPFSGAQGSVLTIDDIKLSSGGTGVNDLDKSSIVVYPDSKHENLIVKDAVDASMGIYSVSGRLISKQSIKSSFENISISDLNKGIYIYKVASIDGTLKTGRFIK